MSTSSKTRRSALRVYTSGMSRITSTDDKDFANVAKATLMAAEVLDDLAPPAEGEQGRVDEFTERRYQRDESVRDAEAALRAAQAERRPPGP